MPRNKEFIDIIFPEIPWPTTIDRSDHKLLILGKFINGGPARIAAFMVFFESVNLKDEFRERIGTSDEPIRDDLFEIILADRGITFPDLKAPTPTEGAKALLYLNEKNKLYGSTVYTDATTLDNISRYYSAASEHLLDFKYRDPNIPNKPIESDPSQDIRNRKVVEDMAEQFSKISKILGTPINPEEELASMLFQASARQELEEAYTEDRLTRTYPPDIDPVKFIDLETKYLQREIVSNARQAPELRAIFIKQLEAVKRGRQRFRQLYFSQLPTDPI